MLFSAWRQPTEFCETDQEKWVALDLTVRMGQKEKREKAKRRNGEMGKRKNKKVLNSFPFHHFPFYPFPPKKEGGAHHVTSLFHAGRLA